MGQTVNLLAYAFGGSNPSLPTQNIDCGSSSVGRALAFQAKGREFEPRLPLQICPCSSGVEHFLGKEEVAGSNPAIGSDPLSGLSRRKAEKFNKIYIIAQNYG